jgi:hypothetical protein
MKKKLLKLGYMFSFLILFPFLAFAANTNCTPLTGISKFICSANEIINSIIPLLIALGVVYFVWGVVMYVIADEEEAKTKGKDRMLYGIIGLTVIISLWGLVNIVVETFGLGGSSAPNANIANLVTQPTGGSGCGTLTGANLPGVLNYFTCIIGSSVIPFLFAIAMVTFVWGAIKFFFIEADEKREEGKQFMLWGIIALAVMISVWGLVGVLADTFGFDHSVLPYVTPGGSGGGGGNPGEPPCDPVDGC